MNISFENKVALVTGAASGIGLATAKAFAEAGAAVALVDINDDAVRSAAADMVAAGHKVIGIHCDVAEDAEVAAMVEQTVSTSDGWTRLTTMLACRAPMRKPPIRTARISTA